MNKRIRTIINDISRSESTFFISKLADKFEVSDRTIRNDINSINSLLKEQKLPILRLEKGGEISKDNSFKEILAFISEDDLYSYKLSKEERKKVAAALLITCSGFITLSTIAEKLYVSRATIINDLDEIKSFVNTGNLQVSSHPNKGLRIEGKESDKRLFLLQLLNQTTNRTQDNVITRFVNFETNNKEVIQKILNEQEHIHKSFLTDDSFQKILMYLEIMINRNKQGEFVEIRTKDDNSKFIKAQDILKYITQYCHINTTDDEIRFLSELLNIAQYIKQKSSSKNAIKVQLITRRFIEKISQELDIDLNDDYDFFDKLSNHLESVFTIEPPLFQENIVIDEILEKNQEIASIVLKESYIIQQYVERPISKEEIGYITVHVCAAIERKKNKEIAFHVIVVCHAGIGTMQLLLEKLKKHFNFQIVDTMSSHEAQNIETDVADFIISTVPLNDSKLNYVIVSPMLTDEDYIRIGNKIDLLRNNRHLPSRVVEKEITAQGLINKLVPKLYEMVPDKAGEIIDKMNEIVEEHFVIEPKNDTEIFSPSLHYLLPHTHITLDVECSDWRNAVIKSAEKMIENGFIEEQYVDAMIKNIEENGPYIVLSEGFAVPHEGILQGSLKVGMNLIRLKNPVPFGEESLDPVEFVCCLSTIDKNTHLKAFFSLVNIFNMKEFKAELRECKTSVEAATLIKKYEYEVSKYL